MKNCNFKLKIVSSAFLSFCLALFIAAALTSAVEVSADSPAPQVSYKIELENGSKFFYMQGTEDIESDENYLDFQSGLYYAESLENIYTVEPAFSQDNKPYNRYIYKSGLHISKDGLYFTNMPWTWANGPYGESGVAIEFFKNGLLIKQYMLSDLTKNKSKFEYSVSHVVWEDYQKRSFDAENNVLSVTTLNNKTITFDLTTGEIINKTGGLSSGQIAAIVIGSVIFLLALSIGGLAVFRHFKKKKSTQ